MIHAEKHLQHFVLLQMEYSKVYFFISFPSAALFLVPDYIRLEVVLCDYVLETWTFLSEFTNYLFIYLVFFKTIIIIIFFSLIGPKEVCASNTEDM